MSNEKRTKRNSRRLTVTGQVQANRRGFGFVRPVGVTPSDADIFLPASLMTGLLDGDTVTVSVENGNARSVTRTHRARTEIFGQVIDGIFHTEPGVGNLSVKVAGTYAADEVVSIHITERSGRIIPSKVKSHGTLNDPNTLAALIFARHMLPLTHTAAQIKEAASIAKSSHRRSSSAQRRDLRDHLVVTIDSPHSQDLDDAVASSVDPDGHIRVWVHIADVSEHVPTGSVLDTEAYQTPTSVYFPDFVRPMLPPVLAHDVLSLLPGVDRDTLTVEMRISPNGSVSSVDVYESIIRSATRLSYTTTARIIDGRRGGELEGEKISPEITDTICWLWAAAARLGQSRTARGGVDAFRVDSLGDGQDSRDDNAHQLIERLMVAANEAVAGWLTERGIPTLYRTHETITGEQAEELEKIADAFGVKAHLGRPVTAQAFAAFAASIDPARSQALWNAILNLLGRASYTAEPKGHFGLGAERYLHFTSPIRRYADVVVHRLVKSYLHGNRSIEGVRSDLDKVADNINPVLQRADQAMREAERSAALQKFVAADHMEKTWNGVITDITSRGLTISTAGVPVSAFVPAREIGEARSIDAKRRRLINADGTSSGIGSRIEMLIVDINVLAARIEGTLTKKGSAKKSSSKSTGSNKAGNAQTRRENSTEKRPSRRRNVKTAGQDIGATDKTELQASKSGKPDAGINQRDRLNTTSPNKTEVTKTSGRRRNPRRITKSAAPTGSQTTGSPAAPSTEAQTPRQGLSRQARRRRAAKR